ncbi:thiamine pyrophosphate-binding protein [Salicibibacter cibarius]|uniref:Thiamine pyrophosphate-binding protein n=1 Tax=Salicibibacter cibarius TaxID=2743000 RepID=A0A7T6Z3D9_9BACI|nr:thiamine pyrophosphate-binding protein [Salicibibacter cibarius]QQK76126.1 thiamine pyrophosphate-binding protein [Salicibibacter cibarius]
MDNNIPFTVSEAIVKELVQTGVDVVYGIVSIHNMPIYEAIRRQGSIRIVTARGESAAVNMADAYGRTTGKLGVVLTSTGAGAGNGAGSLTETWNSSTPLLHITGEADSHYIGTDQRYIHECKDQLKMMDGANKKAYLLKRPKQITPFIREAIKEALTVPTGPVTVSIPTDFQTQIIPHYQLIEAETTERQKRTVDIPPAVIEKVLEAKRPVLWAGKGVIASEASEELLTFVEKIQPGVLTSEAGKGSIPENHSLCIGNFAATPQVEDLLSKSDLLISIGTHFRGEETNDWTLPIPKNHINIDADPNAFNRNFETSYGLIGDAKAVLLEMNKSLEGKDLSPDTAYVEEVKSVRKAVRETLRGTIGPYGDIADSMREQLPEDTILVRDITIPAYTWGNKLFDIYKPRTSITATGGGIGQGLPMAIGAKIGHKAEPVVLMAGDGGFMLNAGEMITAVQEDAPIIILLFDDSGYGILRYLQDAAYGECTSVDLKNPDFVMMAKSMGFESEKVTSVDEFKHGLEKAIASQNHYMIVVDMDKLEPMNYEESNEYIETFRPKK